jgi:elongator complex protein 6
MSSEEQR